MGKDITKAPVLRFKGFTDDWEQRKLVETINVNSGRDYKHLAFGSIPVYGTGGYMLSVDKALSKNEDAIGIGRKGTIDRPYILYAPFWTVDTLFYAIPKKNFDLIFIYSLFQTIDWKSKDESTGVPSLSKSTINSVECKIPKYLEQIKIGIFFKLLDKTITLHQRKLEILIEQKKFFLQKILPSNNSRVPDIRFSNFSNEWRALKLGSIFEQTSTVVNPVDAKLELWSLTVEKGLTPKTARYNRNFLVKKEDQFKAVHNNEFIYNPMNMTLGAVDINLYRKTVAVSGYYLTMILKKGYDKLYFKMWLKSPVAIRKYKLFATGSLIERQRVQFSTFVQISTLIPCLKEQNKMANFKMNLATS